MRRSTGRIIVLLQLALCGFVAAQTVSTTPASNGAEQKSKGRQKPVRFKEEKHANVVIRYYSDETSYMIKPLKMEGPFRTICDRQYVLQLAAEQPKHDLGVVMLVHYDDLAREEAVKAGWVEDLRKLHYQRIVFVRADYEMHANGLPIISESAQVPAIAEAK
jgi:hypothetical protein